MRNLSIFTYVISLMLMCYENKVKVMAATMKPRMVGSPRRIAVFYVFRLIVMYGSLIGLLLSLGVYYALGALLLKVIINRISYKLFFNREVAVWIPHYREMLNDEIAQAEDGVKKRIAIMKAISLAEAHVKDARNWS